MEISLFHLLNDMQKIIPRIERVMHLSHYRHISILLRNFLRSNIPHRRLSSSRDLNEIFYWISSRFYIAFAHVRVKLS